MAHLPNKGIRHPLTKRKSTVDTNAPDDPSNEVLDLRKSTNADKLCYWCGKRGTLPDLESDFCSEICFDQFRRDSFKKRASCMWCNNASLGHFNVNVMSNLDETKFCSDHCLTQFKDGSLGMNGVSPVTVTSPTTNTTTTSSMDTSSAAVKDLITPDLWLKKSPIYKPSASSPTVNSSFQAAKFPRRFTESPGPSSEATRSPPVAEHGVMLPMEISPVMNTKGAGTLYISPLAGKSAAATGSRNFVSSTALMNPSGGNNAIGAANLTGYDCSADSEGSPRARKRAKSSAVQRTSNYFMNQNAGGGGVEQTTVTSSRCSSSNVRGKKPGSGGGGRGGKAKLTSAGATRAPRMLAPNLGALNNCLPFQLIQQHSLAPSSAGATGDYSKLLPLSQNILMANGHSNKLDLGNLGLAFNGGLGLGGFVSNLLMGDDNSTESSTSSGSVISHAMSHILQKEPRIGNSKLVDTQSCGYDNKGSQTDDVPERTAGSMLSMLPPVTVLVPILIAVPIPIPVPIPIILPSESGSGGSGSDRNFSRLKVASGSGSTATAPAATSVNQNLINRTNNNTSTKQETSTENDKIGDSQINSTCTVTTSDNSGEVASARALAEMESSLSAAL